MTSVTSDSHVADDQPPGSKAKSVRSGAAWSGARSIALRVAGQLTTIVVVRIVSPDEFGIWALAITVHSIVSNLADLGVASLLIRRDTDKAELAPSASFIGIAVGALLATIVFTAAPLLASLLGAAEAAPVIRVMSLSVFFTGLFAVPNSLLAREFRQNTVFFASMASLVVSNSTLILLALAGAGPLAFAWSTVLGQFVGGLIIYYKAGWYWPRPELQAVRALLKFGTPLAIANVVNFTYLSIDYAVVSHFKGPTALGTYLLAFNVASWPYAVLGGSINGVSMPALSGTRGHIELEHKVRTITQTVALVGFPAAAMLTALSKPLVTFLYGSKWTEAANTLPLLAPYGAIFLITLILGNLLVAAGKPVRLLLLQLAWLVALFPTMVVLVRLGGARGAGGAHLLITSLVAAPAYLWTAYTCVGLRPIVVLRAVRAPFLLASTAGAMAWLLSTALTNALVSLAACGAVGALAYGFGALPLALNHFGGRLPGSTRLEALSRAIVAGAERLHLSWLYR